MDVIPLSVRGRIGARDTGFISYTCCKTHLPILAGEVFGEEFPERCIAVMIDRDGLLVEGMYDGHGHLDGRSIRHRVAAGAKLVLSRFYEGESYSELGPTNSDPGLGFFHDMGFLELIFSRRGFRRYDDYCAAYFSYEAKVGGAHRIAQEVRRFGLLGAAA